MIGKIEIVNDVSLKKQENVFCGKDINLVQNTVKIF